MDYEAFEVQDDGTQVPVDAGKVNDVLTATHVVILIDHSKRRIYNFNGSESKIRTRFVGARMAAEEIRNKLGLSYNVQAVEEGDESQVFRDLIREMTNRSGSSATGSLGKTPPAPPTVKIFIDKEVAPTIRPSPPERPKAVSRIEEPARESPKPIVSAEAPPSYRSASVPPVKADTGIQPDIDTIISQFGEPPAGMDIEAIIVNNCVYRCAQVQTKIFGKKEEQNRLEKVDNLEGIFTLDGQVKVATKGGKVTGIQVLSKQKTTAIKKPKQSTE
jgi:hypothetical protein